MIVSYDHQDMNIFETTETLPTVPDNLSIPQFFLDYHGNEQLVTNGQPVQGLEPNPWFIEERTGRKIGLAEVWNCLIHLVHD